MQYDMNALGSRAHELLKAGHPRDAMAIYLVLEDGDPSLDAGYLAERVRWCCEALGELHAAKWWYGRAVEQNPTIEAYIRARARLEHISIDQLLRSA